MTVHPLAKVLAWWLFWHPSPAAEADSEPLRLVGPGAPIESTKVHLGFRFHSDAIGDAAITVQLSESVLPW